MQKLSHEIAHKNIQKTDNKEITDNKERQTEQEERDRERERQRERERKGKETETKPHKERKKATIIAAADYVRITVYHSGIEPIARKDAQRERPRLVVRRRVALRPRDHSNPEPHRTRIRVVSRGVGFIL